MKKVLFPGLFLLAVSISQAQLKRAFKPFKVDVAFGAAIPEGSGAKGGVLFAIEPKYSVIDMVSVGLRMEGAVTARGFVTSDGSSTSADVAFSGSYMATGDYYYRRHGFRPFSGIGLGIVQVASASFKDNTDVSVGGGAKFGSMVRSGFEVSHFRLAFEYNIVGKSTQKVQDGTANPPTVTSKNGYMGIKLGFFFGGGKL